MIIAVEVVTPWPTSMRGRANEAVPSVLMTIEISCEVGTAASVWASSRS